MNVKQLIEHARAYNGDSISVTVDYDYSRFDGEAIRFSLFNATSNVTAKGNSCAQVWEAYHAQMCTKDEPKNLGVCDLDCEVSLAG